MKSRGFFCKATGDEAEILIYEQIGESWWDGSGVGAKQFAQDLKALGNVKTLNVRINSPGGDVWDGTAIYNTLVQHPATVNIFIDGLAASAASYIAMAGDTITIAENGMFMIHNASAMTYGNAEEMVKMATLLKQIDASIVLTYWARTKNSKEDIESWMSDETWLVGKEAVDKGFADSIMPSKAIDNAFDLSKFKKAPAQTAAAENLVVLASDADLRRRMRQHEMISW